MRNGSETLREGYEALAARDYSRLAGCLADDVELRTLTGSYGGVEGVRQWIAEMDEGWDPWDLTLDTVQDFGDRVLIEVTLGGRSRVNGIGMSESFWVVWVLRDGRAALGLHFADRDQAVQATEAAASPLEPLSP